MRIGIIGAGAAGCFCAVNLKRDCPEAEVIVLESTPKPLAKVSVTGGGRCNLTNSFRQVRSLEQVYPRGEKLMKRMLKQFSPEATMAWWEREGVRLVTQEDECVFPQSQDAGEIVGTLLKGMHEAGVKLWTNCRVERIELGYRVGCGGRTMDFDVVVVTTGGSPSMRGMEFLAPLDLPIVEPVPSLFTLNIRDQALHELMGTVVEDAVASIPGTKFRTSGPLLITHWGMSGPAILKLTSHAARHLAGGAYQTDIVINWMRGQNEEEVRDLLHAFRQSGKRTGNLHPPHLTARHWAYLLERSGISPEQRWNTLGGKEANRLAARLTADLHHVEGKSRYREEFVTCGGVALSAICPNTLESREHPGLYLAGEVLDVDAVTGGFNLQAAWSMGRCVATALKKSMLT